MEAFLISLGVVAVSEIGDKTQLLALLLAARFKRPAPIIAGIFIATIFNHAIAGAVGGWIASLLTPTVLRWGLGLLFIAMGAWALIPDKLDEASKLRDTATTWGIFWVTTVSFFIAEIGDKTQLATAALAARLDSVALVVAGTTAGMLIADVPAIYLGRFATEKLQSRWIRFAAAALFVIMGVATILADFVDGLWAA
jgi:putative Ca2+/H+ antiporter (TMEM165/GDT1 family)